MLLKAEDFSTNGQAAQQLRMLADRLDRGVVNVNHCRIIPDDPYMLLEVRFVDPQIKVGSAELIGVGNVGVLKLE